MCVEQQAKGKNKSELKYWQYLLRNIEFHYQFQINIPSLYLMFLNGLGILAVTEKRKKKRKRRMATTERAGIFSIFEKRRKNCRKRKQLNKITLPFTR